MRFLQCHDLKLLSPAPEMNCGNVTHKVGDVKLRLSKKSRAVVDAG
jgi:hypothetical protein